MTPPSNPAFERNARTFANELSETLTGSISPVHLRCEFRRTSSKLEALLEFAPSNEDPDLRYVQLGNGSWINIVQRLVPNSSDPRIVSTAKYSYSYTLGGDNPDNEWLVRYDYELGKKNYPESHVHKNAENRLYNEFIEVTRDKHKPLADVHFPTKRISLEEFIDHLLVEFEIPVLHGKSKSEVRKMLAEQQKRFEEKRTR